MSGLRDESGLSIIELTVASLVSAIVVAIAFTLLASSTRTDAYTAGDSEALGSLRLATQRFVKELRQAGKIYPESDQTSIKFWVDYDRNFQQDDADRITWAIREVDGRVAFVRWTDANTQPAVWVDNLLLQDAFEYNLPPPRTTLVRIVLSADIEIDERPPARQVRTQVRLRNAPV